MDTRERIEEVTRERAIFHFIIGLWKPSTLHACVITCMGLVRNLALQVLSDRPQSAPITISVRGDFGA